MNTKHQISLDVIKKWLKDSDWRVRAAAMNACNGREVPFEIIETGLKDDDFDVRTEAMKACRANNIPIPVIRTIEPPDLVYKICVGDVIVVASIPKDAQVRGSFGHKCRANRAVIKQIVGDISGEQVGVSKYDLKTLYYVGDEVEVEDFDFSNEECSTGFHFFCTIEEARNYLK